MNKATLQHYVPQSYLRNFSLNRKQIFFFNKFNQESKSSNVRNVAGERRFYDFPQSVNQPQNSQVEEIFSELETIQGNFLQHIQKKISKVFDLRLNSEKAEKIYAVPILTENQKRDLAFIVSVQYLRTKEFRKFLVEMRQPIEHLESYELENEISKQINEYESIHSIKLNSSTNEAVKSLIHNEYKHILSKVYDDDFDLPILHARAISRNVGRIQNIFYNHIWTIGINNTEQPLFTSDSPVVHYPHLSSSGLASEGIEIVFPLSSKFLLIMRDKQYFHAYKDKESKLFPLTLEDVKHYNMLQIFNSYRFVFCAEDKFDLARSICQEYPEVCSKDRSSVQVIVSDPTTDRKDNKP